MNYNYDNAVLTVNEFELHNIIATLANLFKPEDGGSAEHVDVIMIVPLIPTQFTPELVKEFEDRMNALLRTMHKLDQDLHNKAEYTC